MRRLFQALTLAIAAFSCCGGRIAYAQTAQASCGQGNLVLSYMDRETLTISNSVKQLTATKYAPAASGGVQVQGAVMAFIQIQSNAINWVPAGSDPTSSVGLPLSTGQGVWICRNIMATFKSIRTTASDATAEVVYYNLPSQ